MPKDTSRPPKSAKAESPFQRFERLTKKLVAVPKAGTDKPNPRKRKGT